jgi:hypothetical protein
MKKVFKRLKEPSTWAGLAAIAILFGVEPEKANGIAQALGVVAGAVAVMLPESEGIGGA